MTEEKREALEIARNMVQSPDNWPPMRVKQIAEIAVAALTKQDAEGEAYLKWESCGKCDNRWRCFKRGKECGAGAAAFDASHTAPTASVPPNAVTCSECGGHGESGQRPNESPCAVCGGKGYIVPSPAIESLVAKVLQDVCELPDRTSPDDQPEIMLVTGDELDAIVREAFDDTLAEWDAEFDRLASRRDCLLAAIQDHLQAHEKIARDAQFTRCGCFSCDSFRALSQEGPVAGADGKGGKP